MKPFLRIQFTMARSENVSGHFVHLGNDISFETYFKVWVVFVNVKLELVV